MQLIIEKFSSWNFRNLDSEMLSFGPGLNLFLGANGQGKTNLLEALAVLANLRSFRGASPRKMVRIGSAAYRLQAWIQTPSGDKEIRQIVELGSTIRRQISVNESPVSVAEYLQYVPVYALSAEDLQLVRGLPHFRRALLDRMVFFDDPDHLDKLNRYQTILRQRNAALREGENAAELDVWEEQLARSAAAIVRSRLRVFQSWKPLFFDLYRRLRADDFPEIEIEYRWEFENDEKTDLELAENYRERYDRGRSRDCRIGYTVDGPHRHDLQLRVGDRPLRDLFSSGQTKIVAAALSLSGLVEVESRSHVFLPVLADDIDAELDERVLKKLVNFLGSDRQVFLASAHRDSILKFFPQALQFEVHEGRADRGVHHD